MTDNLLTCDLEKSALSGPQPPPPPHPHPVTKAHITLSAGGSLEQGGDKTKLSKTSKEQPVTGQIVALKRRTLGLNLGAVRRGQEGYCYRTVYRLM